MTLPERETAVYLAAKLVAEHPGDPSPVWSLVGRAMDATLRGQTTNARYYLTAAEEAAWLIGYDIEQSDAYMDLRSKYGHR